MKPEEISSAIFSPCKKYRYVLWRVWDKSLGYVNFVCLNPSTADEIHNDPTIIRCINYAHNGGTLERKEAGLSWHYS